MKKLYYIAALAAIGLASCTSEEEVITKVEPQPITFKAVTKKASRTALDGVVLPKETKLFVSAYHLGDDNPTEPFHQYFHNKLFTYDKGAEGYISKSAPVYPEGGDLHFIAYTSENYKKVGEDTGIDATNSAYPKMDQVAVEADHDATNPHISKLILPYGDALQGATDVMYSEICTNVGCTNQSDANMLTLHHALAWLKVNFNAQDELNDYILIKDVKVNNAAFSGTVEVEIEKNANKDYTYTVNTTSPANVDTKEFPAYQGKVMKVAKAASVSADGLLVPRQNRKVISFAYCKKQDESASVDLTNVKPTDGNITGYSHWQTVTIEDDNNLEWLGGYRYTYVITISKGTPIKFDCEVGKWEDGDAGSGSYNPEVMK